ncbi:MAG TPA: hypothetical protein VEY09_12385 [Pyrinomonadaceae bacterium]|nr:hypothetical protein [Pyrinomonadaceae bacterium]
MIIELRSREQFKRAVERARNLKPFVRVRGFRWYEVESSSGQDVYTVHFWDSINGSGHILGECNCRGESGFVYYHLAAAIPVHLWMASTRGATQEQ